MKYKVPRKVAFLVAAIIFAVGIALAVAGAGHHRKECLWESRERGSATVVNRWTDGQTRWVELEGEFPDGESRKKVQVTWSEFAGLVVGRKVLAVSPSHNAPALDQCGKPDGMSTWCYFLFAGMCILFGIGVIWAGTQGLTLIFEELSSTAYTCLAILFGGLTFWMMPWPLAALMMTTAAEIRKNGSEMEARIVAMRQEREFNGGCPTSFLYLAFPDDMEDVPPERVLVYPTTYACASTGAVIKVWAYKNRHFVDAYGELDHEPPSLPLSLASVCGGFFLMGYFIRKARQAKRRERMMGGT